MQCYILLSTNYAIRLRLEGYATAKSMLDFLEHEITLRGKLYSCELKLRLINTRLANHDDVEQYCDPFQQTIAEISQAGAQMPAEDQLVLFIANLRHAHEMWHRMQLQNSKDPLSLDWMIKDWVDECWQKAPDGAFSAVARGHGHARTRPECEHCGKQGHKKDKCYCFHPDDTPEGSKPQKDRRVKGIEYERRRSDDEPLPNVRGLPKQLDFMAKVAAPPYGKPNEPALVPR